MKTRYIIEHLEPKLWPWCLIEYKNISKIVGKSNLIFTNISKKDKKKLSSYGKVFVKSVKDLDIDLKSSCVLDPAASRLLTPKDSKKFRYYIFGGILGDNPPKQRTFPEITKFLKKAQARNLGKSQFSTDNAVFVTREIAKGKKLQSIKFQDRAEIKINSVESVILPYKYPIVKGKAKISKELVNYIRKHPYFEI